MYIYNVHLCLNLLCNNISPNLNSFQGFAWLGCAYKFFSLRHAASVTKIHRNSFESGFFHHLHQHNNRACKK